jgi:hypothetical protein
MHYYARFYNEKWVEERESEMHEYHIVLVFFQYFISYKIPQNNQI